MSKSSENEKFFDNGRVWFPRYFVCVAMLLWPQPTFEHINERWFLFQRSANTLLSKNKATRVKQTQYAKEEFKTLFQSKSERDRSAAAALIGAWEPKLIKRVGRGKNQHFAFVNPKDTKKIYKVHSEILAAIVKYGGNLSSKSTLNRLGWSDVKQLL